MTLLPFFIFLLVAITLGSILILISNLLGTTHKGVRKHNIYESGVNPVGAATRRYDVKFYLVGILFLLFDVEIVFLVPWVLTYKASTSKLFMIYEFVFFMVILLVGYFYVLGSKSLKWED